MNRQYTISFPSLEKLKAFKLSLTLEAYLIDVSKKTIKCICSELQLEDAVKNYDGSLQTR